MSSTEEVKSVTLSGTAASEYMGGASLKKKGAARRKTQKIRFEGGEEDSEMYSASPTQPSSQVIMKPMIQPPPPVISVQIAEKPLVSAAPIVTSNAAPSADNQQGGSTKQIKVELKKRGSAKRVHLQPKKTVAVVSKKLHPMTRRVRHFTLGVSSLQKRMTRAKKMHKKVADMPLDKLKEVLVQKKLIKTTSKAPESVLRQIAADAQIVAGKAL